MPAFIKASFSRGEISPKLYGRVDTAAYQVALKTALNVVAHASGGLSRRPGLLHVGPIAMDGASGTNSWLFPFKFNKTDSYIVEVNAYNQEFRFTRNDATVVDSSKVISGTQLATVTKASPMHITWTGGVVLANGDELIFSGIQGMTELNGMRAIVANATAGACDLLNVSALPVNFDSTGFSVFSASTTSRVDVVYRVAYPNGSNVGMPTEYRYVQSADVVTFTGGDSSDLTYRSPYELRRNDHDDWDFVSVSFGPGISHPTTVAGTQNGTTGSTTYKYKVTAIAEETFEESLPGTIGTSKTITAVTKANPAKVTSATHGFVDGDEVYLTGIGGMVQLNGRRFTVDYVDANNFNLKGEDSTGYITYTTGGSATLTLVKITNGNATLSATNNITLTWTELEGAQRYAVYREDNGLYGLIGETEEPTYKDDGGDTPDLESTPPKKREPFIGAPPAAVGYYQQRRIFGGSIYSPDTTDFSRTGDHSNFTISSPAKPDDAFRVTLNSEQVNQIMHYVALDHLLVFTTGEEWKVDSGDNNRFSPDTVRIRPQSGWGSSYVKPVKIGKVVLFVQSDSRTVRSIGYELAVDGYTGTDMTLLSKHIFESADIIDWTFCSKPDPVLYIVKSDGSAAALTFNQEQEVIAWTNLKTKGKFISVTSVLPTQLDMHYARSYAEQEDAPYFVVEREINGKRKHFLERFYSRQGTDSKDSYFLDGGSFYEDVYPIRKTMGPEEATQGIVLANPVQVNLAPGYGSGLSNGDIVEISGINWKPNIDADGNETQPDQLNGHTYKLAGKSTDRFNLTDPADDSNIDGTGWNDWDYVLSNSTLRLNPNLPVLRKGFTSISGLHHLANETVTVVADGVLVGEKTVSQYGVLTLDERAFRVQLGFGYVSDIETLDIEIPNNSGTLQGRLKNVHEVMVRVQKTRNLLIGPDKDNLSAAPWREFASTEDSTELKTGDVFVTLDPDWNSNGRFLIRQKDPFPMTLLAIVPQMEAEGLREE